MHRKKTKIICTISDKRCDTGFIASLFYSGMNVVRINTAHTTPESALEIVKNVRSVSDEIAIMIDTKGPEIRLTAIENGESISVSPGDTICFGNETNTQSSAKILQTNYQSFVTEVPPGVDILLDDGEISLTVVRREEDRLVCRVNNPGIIKGKKSINIPNVPIKLPPVSEKDKEFIIWAIRNDIDFIAHSFVRDRKDLAAVQSILDQHNSPVKIIAKIENQEGVNNIDEILNHCYGIMVARGDLGVEIEYQKIPAIQRNIIEKCHRRKKPVIIATQMLHTMIEHPRPTRAEVTDVANAIFQSTDAIMLSGETAAGRYPVEAVCTMAKIAIETEKSHQPFYNIDLEGVTAPVAAVLARSMVQATSRLSVKAIVFDTRTGRTGRYISAFRPKVPVYAMCYSKRVMRELALSYGIYSYTLDLYDSKDDFLRSSVKRLLKDKRFSRKDLIGVIAGSFGPSSGATFMEISQAVNMII